MTDIDARFALAKEIIREAGRIAMDYQRNLESLTISEKGPQDLVSEADRNTEAYIKGAIREAYPQDAFVGEETGADGVTADAGAWVVDPIDGTQPFLLGLPTWSISMAFVTDDTVEFGLILCPPADELYAGRRGQGATRNDRQIAVSSATSLSQGLTGVGCSPRTRPGDLALIMERLLANGGMYHRIGSGALNLCYVAAGQLIGYVEMHINAWDCLAALRIVEEAGGKANDFLGEHGVTGGGRVIAGGPGVYDHLLALLPD